MSAPPTEVLEISNDSLFSDSAVLDEMEMLPKLEPGGPQPQLLKSKKGLHMKTRKNETTMFYHLEPITLKVPDDDPEDEFDIATAMNIIYENDDDDLAAMRNGEPDFRGDIMNCFNEPGLLYRVFNRELKTWAFYNDSVFCEIHVSTTFGKHSKVIPLESTTIRRNEEGEIEANVVVYPGETEMFVKGFINGFKSKLLALPLSDDYLAARSEAQWRGVIQPEIDAIRAVVGDETDTEVVLAACLEHNLPFVDLSFPPTADSFRRDAQKRYPWARPAMYLQPEQRDQVRLFRQEITPNRVILGDLGNCWMGCALAAVAENPSTILAMFRHPSGAVQARRERAVGAYRVSFNKNGLWRSVVVDDYFPVIASALQVAHSSDPCELWPAILEKAFAKLHGSYTAVESGDPVLAITDVTGAPSLRVDDELDDVFAEDEEDGGGSKMAQTHLSGAQLGRARNGVSRPRGAGVEGVRLLDRLRHACEEGYGVLFTTPGRAPAVVPGTDGVPDLSEDPELEGRLTGTGLLPGHAYAVRRVGRAPGKGEVLFQLRNPWPWGTDHRCRWSRTAPSSRWHAHPGEVARAAGFDPDDSTALWLTWEEVLEYFTGGGIVFTRENASELRIPITFYRAKPSVVLQIHVTQPTKMWMMLSNIDNRVIYKDAPKFSDDYANSSNYPPIMLSLASYESNAPNTYRIRYNSTSEPVEPSTNKWTFLQARDIAMLCELTPSKCPYLLIPRLMDCELPEGFVRSSEDFRRIVGAEHFLNSCAALCPEPGMEKAMSEIPMTLGLRVEGDFSGCQIALRNLPAENSVFANFPKFSTEKLKKPTGEGVLYQTKSPNQGFAVRKWSKDIL